MTFGENATPLLLKQGSEIIWWREILSRKGESNRGNVSLYFSELFDQKGPPSVAFYAKIA
jgi:hypothetical protein